MKIPKIYDMGLEFFLWKRKESILGILIVKLNVWEDMDILLGGGSRKLQFPHSESTEISNETIDLAPSFQ